VGPQNGGHCWQVVVNSGLKKRKLWSRGRVLGSRLEGRGINPLPMLDGSGVKAMPGLIPAPNSGSCNIRKERKYR